MRRERIRRGPTEGRGLGSLSGGGSTNLVEAKALGIVRGDDRLQAAGNKGEFGPVLVTPVRGVSGRFQGPGVWWGARAVRVLILKLRRHGLGQGPAFGDVKPHLPQGLGDPACSPQWPRTLGKRRERLGTTGRKSEAGGTNSGLEIQGRLLMVKGKNFYPRRGHLGL